MKAKHIIRTVAFVLVAALLICFTMAFVKVNNSRDCVGLYGFEFEPKDSLDVVLFGPSQIYTSYYPAYAYEKYGYTSFSISSSAMPSSMYLSALKQVRERQNPQLYIFELSGFYYKDQKADSVIRKYLDNVPTLADYRLEAIEKYVPEKERESYYIPFIKYHNNLDNIKTCFDVMKEKIKIRKRGYSLFKNFSPTNNIFNVLNPKLNKYTRTKVSDESFKIFYELIDYLKQENITNVIFANFPDANEYDNNESYQKLNEEVVKAGFTYVDFHNKDAQNEIGIDYEKDFYNLNHLNINGTEKMTTYLGNYIMSNYNIDTNHSEEVKKEWDDCASIADEIIQKQKDKLIVTDKEVKQNIFEEDFFSTKQKK